MIVDESGARVTARPDGLQRRGFRGEGVRQEWPGREAETGLSSQACRDPSRYPVWSAALLASGDRNRPEAGFGFIFDERNRRSKADITAHDRVQVVLAEPFPGAVDQGVILVFVKEFRRL